MRRIITFLCFLSLLFSVEAQSIFPTRLYDASVASLQVKVVGEGEWRPYPYYQLGAFEQLEISFDCLGGENESLTYTLTYCTADWKKCPELQAEAVKGFERGEIKTSHLSKATRENYRHYSLILDNSSSPKPQLSGNYILKVFRSSGFESEPILETSFAVLSKDAIDTSLSFTSATEKGLFGEWQQVEVSLSDFQLDEVNAREELLVYVGQNGRRDNTQLLNTPSGISLFTVSYEDASSAVFEGGNEYYSFEVLNDNRTPMGVEHISREENERQLYLFAQRNRSTSSYVREDDADGRYIIRSVGTFTEEPWEADYYRVHFTYNSEKLPYGQRLYLIGEAFESLPLEERELNYDEEKERYSTSLLLKGGYVSFSFATTAKEGGLTTIPTEGSHYETSNTYTALVYYRGKGSLQDQLIGVCTKRN